MESCRLHLIFLFLVFTHGSTSQSIIEKLPGYPGTLPFKLETGYVGVGEKDEVQLFYYFVESENDPETDPLLFWLTGGPGCSGFSGLVFEIGPLTFDLEDYDGSFPSFTINPYSWTKVGSIIFIDSPVGTGFSYSTSTQGYNSSDTKAAKDNYLFLRKWLSMHPKFVQNNLYVAGDSYGGKIVPMVALEIAKGFIMPSTFSLKLTTTRGGIQPRILLQGYIIGNSVTDANMNENEIIPYAYRMTLISDEYFEVLLFSYHEYVFNSKINEKE